jgi:hypothetical protein
MSPQRVQRQRTKGWRMPLCSCGCGKPAIYVGRPTKWGNPFRVYRCTCCGFWDVIDDNNMTYHVDHAVARKHPELADYERDKREATRHAVELFLNDFDWCAKITAAEVRRELAGHDLACWCALDRPCHADVLLELANGGLR